MGEDNLLVDTDVLIAYLNRRSHREYLEDAARRIYYSAVTKKELLSKPGLKASERGAILALLRRFRQIRIDSRVVRGVLRVTFIECEFGSTGRAHRCVRPCKEAPSSDAERPPLRTDRRAIAHQSKGNGAERAQESPEKESKEDVIGDVREGQFCNEVIFVTTRARFWNGRLPNSSSAGTDCLELGSRDIPTSSPTNRGFWSDLRSMVARR